MGQRLEETAEADGVVPLMPAPGRLEIIDRLSLIFHEARALEFAINGASLEPVTREALLGIAIRHADQLGELLDDIEEGR